MFTEIGILGVSGSEELLWLLRRIAKGPKTNLDTLYRELLEENPQYQGVLRNRKPEEITSYDLFEVYPQGDEIATKTFDIAIEMWGMAVANLVSLFDPSKIIFGGGVFGPALQFLDRIKQAAVRHAQPIAIQKVEIVPSMLGGDAVLMGAGYLALRSISE